MLWEEMSSVDFDPWLQKSKGVCVLPIGVLEKHGDHLPVGTDMYAATAVAQKAAEREDVVVFPYYFLGQIAEARHVKGALCASHRLIMDALLEMCDEIHRNGFRKILLLNSHGGNLQFLSFFAQMFMGLDRPYGVYTCFLLNDKLDREIQTATGQNDLGGHAGFLETSLMMHLRPDLVHPQRQDPSEGVSLNRLQALREHGVFTGFDWYADYPNHIAGDPTQASAEHGKLIFDLFCDHVSQVIRAIKDDTVSPALIAEYNRACQT